MDKVKKYFLKMIAVFLVAMLFMSCKEQAEIAPVLTVSTSEIHFAPEGGVDTMTIECNDQWSISNSAASWLQLSQTSGNNSTTTIRLTIASANTTGATRSVILIISSQNGQARRVTVSQAAQIFPSYNTSPKAPDQTGMGSTATQLIAKIKLGVNIGNTFELSAWNQPDPTEAYIQLLKESGFNAVRLPGGWYLNSNKKTAKINDSYMARVKQTVQWCVDRDMYVLLNIHWDGGWLEQNCTLAKKDSVNARQKALWEQIATAMRDFDEHLMFASANEPNADNAEQMNVLLSYHKTFIDAVRSTGGRNTYRTLVLQGHTDYIKPENFPADPTPNRLAFEWHNYTPSSFTILYNDRNETPPGWDDVRFYWGEGNYSSIEPGRNCTYGFESDLLAGYNQIKTRFIDKGIPCLMGEYSAQRWTATRNKFVPREMDKHNKSVDDWITFNTKQCKAIGAAPFYWETGGVFDRVNNVVLDQRSLDALIAGSK
jgi:aryl-phospho-beta-D-glucosidase BglC (GH1 family)